MRHAILFTVALVVVFAVPAVQQSTLQTTTLLSSSDVEPLDIDIQVPTENIGMRRIIFLSALFVVFVLTVNNVAASPTKTRSNTGNGHSEVLEKEVISSLAASRFPEAQYRIAARLQAFVCVVTALMGTFLAPSPWHEPVAVTAGKGETAAAAAQLAASAVNTSLCLPLSNPSGTWIKIPNANPDDREFRYNLEWQQTNKECTWAVGNYDDFFSRLDGQAIVFAGDSTVREFVFNFVRGINNCCSPQKNAGLVCSDALQLDQSVCEIVNVPRKQYFADITFPLRRGARAVNISFLWLGYPKEASTIAPWLMSLIEGTVDADLIILSAGFWSMTYEGPTDTDGGNEAMREWLELVDIFDFIGDARPDLLEKVVFRTMYTLEVDGPGFKRDKRPVARTTVESMNAAVSKMWANAGYRTWNVTHMIDVRVGGAQRPFNEVFLTYDGVHARYDVDIELGWEIFSHAATKRLHRAFGRASVVK